MKTRRVHMIFWTVAMMLVWVSCSSSGGGVGGSGIISRGSITEFGSIVVNGTEFDTTDAVVIVDGVEQGVGDVIVRENLDVGRVVTVMASEGDDENGVVADQVSYSDDVSGPVISMTDIDSGTKALRVMGQTVVLNSLTVFKAATFETIAPDDVVEVSGYYDNTGVIWATFLEKIGTYLPGVTYEVKGFIDSLDTGQQTFLINDLLVDYSSAEMGTLPGGMPEEDLLVEIEGILDVTRTQMFASRITLEDELGSENAEEVEVMGFVTALASVDEFTIGNQVVMVEAGALFVDGVQTDIALGVKLEAEGTLADGILFAEEIEFWAPDQIEIEGLVTSIVSASEFMLDGQRVITTAETVYEDGGPEDIAVGIAIEIKGRMVDDIMVADKVSFELGDV